MIQAHLVGKTYGKLPSDVLREHPRDYWLNAQIRAAGVRFENEAKRKARRNGSAGVATEGEKEDLVEANERRADRREAGQADLGDQMDALNDADTGGGRVRGR